MPAFARTFTCFALGLLTGTSVLAQNSQVNIQVDAAADRKAISPYIYGLAFTSTSVLLDLNYPLQRWGGNYTSRYNWQQDADNRAADWYFQSVPEGAGAPAGVVDQFISATKAANAEPMITLPLLDWVAKLGPSRSKLASFSQAKYGEQTDADWAWFPDAGNGILVSTGQRITGNDPNDANTPNSTALQSAFVQHLLTQWGNAASGGLRYYVMDNEHSIWFETHRDVAPIGATMEQVRQKMIDYGTVIRQADPGAKIVGPEEWGWLGMIYSGFDQQYAAAHGWSSFPDRAAHGNMDYLPWLLGQLRQHEQNTGLKLLDIFTVHYYPQGGEYGNNTTTSMQLRRNRSTRSLWDPVYVDETWVNTNVMLIPRIKQWISTHYPGLQTGITEYNWGAEGHINGATAQADVLGIFGREGLDYAARWTTPASNTPTYKALKMYRNYDGSKSTFGETSVRAQVPNPDELSAFAALRAGDGALTLMVINKVLSGNTPIQISLANFLAAGTAQVWQLTSANTINRLADLTLSGDNLSATVPPQSITLFVIAALPKVQRAFVASGGSDANTSVQCPLSSPCRTFAAAAGVVLSGGELVALDSGDFGSMTAIDSISLIGAPGHRVSIDVPSGDAVTIATPGIRVVLRNLAINGLGGVNGINVTSGAKLLVQDCIIGGFASGSGITASGVAEVHVERSLLRDNAVGLYLANGAKASVSHSRLLGNTGNGAVAVGNAAGTTTRLTLRKVVLHGTGTDWGVTAQSLSATGAAHVDVTHSTIGRTFRAAAASSSAGGAATLTLARSRISGSGTGLYQSGPGAVLRSLENNTLTGNGANSSGTIVNLPSM